MNLFCSQTQGSAELFNELAYRKNGLDALKHLFDVGAGLDSQILGDYEIVGQLRKAMKFAKERGFIHSFLERTLNQVLQSSKEIKNNTALSDGTVSVAFAAVQYIRENIDSLNDKQNSFAGHRKNRNDHLQEPGGLSTGTSHITLMNRTPEKAENLASPLI